MTAAQTKNGKSLGFEAGAAQPQGPEPILAVLDLIKEFPIRQGLLVAHKVGAVRAVSGVSFELFPTETLGLVGGRVGLWQVDLWSLCFAAHRTDLG
jgi:ABC-type glutathione transport system ATPase component